MIIFVWFIYLFISIFCVFILILFLFFTYYWLYLNFLIYFVSFSWFFINSRNFAKRRRRPHVILQQKVWQTVAGGTFVFFFSVCFVYLFICFCFFPLFSFLFCKTWKPSAGNSAPESLTNGRWRTICLFVFCLFCSFGYVLSFFSFLLHLFIFFFFLFCKMWKPTAGNSAAESLTSGRWPTICLFCLFVCLYAVCLFCLFFNLFGSFFFLFCKTWKPTDRR